ITISITYSLSFFVFFLIIPRQPPSTLFPYTTLFRSFLVVETCELGKSCRLGHHELRDSGHRRLPHQPPVFPHQLLHQLAGAASERLGEGLTLGDDRHDRLPHHRLEQGFLTVEVQVDGALGHTGSTGHVGELRRGEPALSEHLKRGGHDLPRPGVLPTLPARLGLAL